MICVTRAAFHSKSTRGTGLIVHQYVGILTICPSFCNLTSISHGVTSTDSIASPLNSLWSPIWLIRKTPSLQVSLMKKCVHTYARNAPPTTKVKTHLKTYSALEPVTALNAPAAYNLILS